MPEKIQSRNIYRAIKNLLYKQVKNGSEMNSLLGQDEDDEVRLQEAEEAVRIVRRFNTARDKEERQKKIIELCTDIAGILDAKRR